MYTYLTWSIRNPLIGKCNKYIGIKSFFFFLNQTMNSNRNGNRWRCDSQAIVGGGFQDSQRSLITTLVLYELYMTFHSSQDTLYFHFSLVSCSWIFFYLYISLPSVHLSNTVSFSSFFSLSHTHNLNRSLTLSHIHLLATFIVIKTGWGCLCLAAMTTRTEGSPSLLFPWWVNSCCALIWP